MTSLLLYQKDPSSNESHKHNQQILAFIIVCCHFFHFLVTFYTLTPISPKILRCCVQRSTFCLCFSVRYLSFMSIILVITNISHSRRVQDPLGRWTNLFSRENNRASATGSLVEEMNRWFPLTALARVPPLSVMVFVLVPDRCIPIATPWAERWKTASSLPLPRSIRWGFLMVRGVAWWDAACSTMLPLSSRARVATRRWTMHPFKARARSLEYRTLPTATKCATNALTSEPWKSVPHCQTIFYRQWIFSKIAIIYSLSFVKSTSLSYARQLSIQTVADSQKLNFFSKRLVAWIDCRWYRHKSEATGSVLRQNAGYWFLNATWSFPWSFTIAQAESIIIMTDDSLSIRDNSAPQSSSLRFHNAPNDSWKKPKWTTFTMNADATVGDRCQLLGNVESPPLKKQNARIFQIAERVLSRQKLYPESPCVFHKSS